MNELHLFAGAGGGILAGQLVGHRCVCAVELEPYAQAVLLARQNDGTFPPFPIWDDVQTFDGRPWRGIVDVVAGGFPCQDISVAGTGAGLDGERSGMWHHMARIIGEVRPRYAFIENSPALVGRGLDRVLCDLAEMGFDACWSVLGADAVGGPHKRERIWIVANAAKRRLERWDYSAALNNWKASNRSIQALDKSSSWPDVSDPSTFGDCNGVAARTDRLKAIGNGQVPRVAAAAFHFLSQTFTPA